MGIAKRTLALSRSLKHDFVGNNLHYKQQDESISDPKDLFNLDQFLDTMPMMCILEHANMEHTIFALAALQWLVIVKEGGSNFMPDELWLHQVEEKALGGTHSGNRLFQRHKNFFWIQLPSVKQEWIPLFKLKMHKLENLVVLDSPQLILLPMIQIITNQFRQAIHQQALDH